MLDQEGVLLEAIARQVRISWDDLASVGPPRWTIQRGCHRWSRRNGEGVTTARAFPDVHRMLSEVERRAPHASVRS
jgi:hypothetical protein